MKLYQTNRGFWRIDHPGYGSKAPPEDQRLIQESSAIGDYPDSMDKPGSSFLWVGEGLHLNREEVSKLVGYMQTWLSTGRLSK